MDLFVLCHHLRDEGDSGEDAESFVLRRDSLEILDIVACEGAHHEPVRILQLVKIMFVRQLAASGRA